MSHVNVLTYLLELDYLNMMPIYLLVSCVIRFFRCSSSDWWSLLVIFARPHFIGLAGVGDGFDSLSCHLLDMVVSEFLFDAGARSLCSTENYCPLLKLVRYTTVLTYY